MMASKPRGPEFWENPEDERHGSTNGYSNLNCRCDRCKEAWTVYHREYMHGGDRLLKHAEKSAERRGGRQKPYQARKRKNQEGEWVDP